MGAAAFVIAEYTGNTYWAVCIAAFLPSVLYFTCMFFVVDVRARKQGMTGLPKDQLPDFKESAKKVIPLLIPITVLVILLALQFSTQFAVMYSIVALILSYLPFKGKRVGIRKIFKALALASKIMIPITTSCAGCGLIVGIMSMTGFGERLAYGILAVANGNLYIGLAFTALMCVILGMGLPTLAAYIVLAALGVPALVQLGAPLLAAHLFVFYVAILSAITPPVCLSAYVGAGIAGAKPMKVGITAMTMAPFIYVLPFMFVVWPGLLLNAPFLEVIKCLVEFLLFMFPVIIVPQKFWMTKMNIIEMVLFALCTLSFFIFRQYALASMAVFFAAGSFLHWTRYLKEKKANKAVA
jgi:TRAP transporter 4TM/12TM fusion protein